MTDTGFSLWAKKPPNLSHYHSGFITTDDGASIYYEVEGEGAPIILCNNFTMDCSQWKKFTRYAKRGRKIIRYDLRNQGLSSQSSTVPNIERHIADLKMLIERCSDEKPVLVGFSESTIICKEFSLKYPHLLRAQVLVSPVFSAYGNMAIKLLILSWCEILKKGGLEALFQLLYPLFYTARSIESFDSSGYIVVRDRFIKNNCANLLSTLYSGVLVGMNKPDVLRDLETPTLLLGGKHDFLSNENDLSVMTQIMPRARYDMIELSGHSPHLETPAIFAEKILQFAHKTSTREDDLLTESNFVKL